MKPIVIDSVFTDEEYASIYEIIDPLFPENFDRNNLPDGLINANDVGYFAYIDELPSKVRMRIRQIASEATGLNLDKIDLHFARYTKLTGSVPKLVPHYDQKLTRPTVTMSIQLNTTLPWTIYAERDPFLLETNQALIFSGSHQVHWRPDLEFEDNDYFDIFVCQIYESGSTVELSDEHRQAMQERMQIIGQEFKDIIRD
jgi:hypothetical protein